MHTKHKRTRTTLLTTESPTYLRRLAREIHANVARSGVYYSIGEICRRIVDCKTRRVGRGTVLVLKCMGGTWLVFDVQVGHLEGGNGSHVVASRQH